VADILPPPSPAAAIDDPPRFALGEPQVRLEHVRVVQVTRPSW
jgi:hypothetical protein